jgi:hypothetical protein
VAFGSQDGDQCAAFVGIEGLGLVGAGVVGGLIWLRGGEIRGL